MIELSETSYRKNFVGPAAETKKRLAMPITRTRLENALHIMADIVTSGEEKYLPIFLRLERELASCIAKQNAIERAQLICGKNK